jgi:hypothetical protein
VGAPKCREGEGRERTDGLPGREVVSDLDAEGIARKAMAIAAEICVYTNNNLTIETLATA